MSAISWVSAIQGCPLEGFHCSIHLFPDLVYESSLCKQHNLSWGYGYKVTRSEYRFMCIIIMCESANSLSEYNYNY